MLTMILAAIALGAPAQDDTGPPRITNGPVVESLGPTSGLVAWSTNVSSGSVVNYGTDSAQLTERAEMPWGGYTHRVTLRPLKPDTAYFFQASSPDTKGSGEVLKSEVGQFHTPPASAKPRPPAPPGGLTAIPH